MENQDVWENECMPTPVRCFAVRLHSMGLSVREVEVVLNWLGVDRCYQTVQNWKEKLTETQRDPRRHCRRGSRPTRSKSRLTATKSGSTPPSTRSQNCYWKSTCTAAAGLIPRRRHRFLVDAGGYLTALARRELSGQLDYSERNHIEKWFQTVAMRIDCFHSFWRGSQSSARRWLQRFRHYYNHNRPNQALDGRTPAEEVLN